MEEMTKKRSSEFFVNEIDNFVNEIEITKKNRSSEISGTERFFGTGYLKMFGGLTFFRSLQCKLSLKYALDTIIHSDNFYSASPSPLLPKSAPDTALCRS